MAVGMFQPGWFSLLSPFPSCVRGFLVMTKAGNWETEIEIVFWWLLCCGCYLAVGVVVMGWLLGMNQKKKKLFFFFIFLH